MTTEAKVADHYTRGSLENMILQAMERAGKDPANLTVQDLAPIDEFHVEGLEATQALAAQMSLQPGMRLLDVGSGIGGPARYFAAAHGCKVTGIDLTDEFVQVAKRLTQLVKLHDRVEFRQASALDLPFQKETFDRASMIHVGMNIADKAGVYREVRRVMKPSGVFALFDIVRSADGELRYPVPWALSDDTSFVAKAAEYREALDQAGFRVIQERDRRDSAIAFTRRMMARTAQNGPPILGLQLLMGNQTCEMLKNVLAMMEQGILSPLEIYAEANGQTADRTPTPQA